MLRGPDSRRDQLFNGIGASAIAPTPNATWFLHVPADMTAFGMRPTQIGSSADCLVHGVAFTYKGPPLEP